MKKLGKNNHNNNNNLGATTVWEAHAEHFTGEVYFTHRTPLGVNA